MAVGVGMRMHTDRHSDVLPPTGHVLPASGNFVLVGGEDNRRLLARYRRFAPWLVVSPALRGGHPGTAGFRFSKGSSSAVLDGSAS